MALAQQGIDTRNYARLGYGFCAFACEESATQFEAVRQAIAYSFDRDGFIAEYLGSFGIAVYSYYGVGQWMTLAAMARSCPAMPRARKRSPGAKSTWICSTITIPTPKPPWPS